MGESRIHCQGKLFWHVTSGQEANTGTKETNLEELNFLFLTFKYAVI
jgi:hypothetical protein